MKRPTPWERGLKRRTLLGALAVGSALVLGACGTASADAAGDSEPAPTAEKARTASETYVVPKHPLMVTRSGSPRTSLAVALENGFDLPLTINREASMSFKRYSNSGVARSETSRLDEALVLASPKVSEVVKLNSGSTLHRTDVRLKISEAVPMQTLMSFLKRIEKSPYLTASEVHFQTAPKWWGVCKSKTKVVVSSWFARGRVSLPETQVHMPKVSATRVAYEMVAAMRSGELNAVAVGPKTFKASGVAKSAAALDQYISGLDHAHRCIGAVDVDSRLAGNGAVAFELSGKLKCRTR